MDNGKTYWFVACLLVLLASLSFAAGETEMASDDSGPVPLVVLSTRANFDKPDSPMQEQVHQKIMDVVGIDIQPITVPGAELDTRANLMLAAREQLDWIPYRSRQVATTYYSQGATIAITEEMFKEHAPNYWALVNPTTLKATELKFGNYLGIGVETSVTHAAMLEVRGDWVSKAGMELPDTVSEFETYLDWTIANDPDGNGVDDTIPFITFNLQTLFGALAPTYLEAGYTWWLNDDGRLMPPFMDPDFPNLLMKLREWNDKGYQYAEDFVAQQQQKLDWVVRNKVASYAGLWTSYVYEGIDILAQTLPEARFVPVVLNGEGVNALERKSRFHSAAQITTMCEYPEGVLKYYDFTSTEDGFLTVWYGFEGESFEKKDQATYTLQMIDTKGNPTQNRMDTAYALYYHFGTIRPTARPEYVIDTLTNRINNELSQRIESLPGFLPIDALTTYDRDAVEEPGKTGDLETFINEQLINVVAGKRPVSEWSQVIDQWLSMGGSDLIDDRTSQFHGE